MYWVLLKIWSFLYFIIQFLFKTEIGPDKEYLEWRMQVANYPDNYPEFYHNIRRRIWAENYYYVERHNKNPFTNYKLKLNAIADRTHAEYFDIYLKQRYGMRSRKKLDRAYNKNYNRNIINIDEKLKNLISVPKTVNYTLHEPLDQAGCGACYIFSALAILEVQMAKLMGRNDLRLSAQYVIDCAAEDNRVDGCYGGYPRQVWEFINDNGIMEEKDYGYFARGLNCNLTERQKSKILRPHISYDIVKLSKLKYDSTILKNLLVSIGPAITGFDAHPRQLFLYGSGILDDQGCEDINPNHSVAIMGYGSDEITGQEYLILQNSAGPFWGENGFFKIKMGVNFCGILDELTFINVTMTY